MFQDKIAVVTGGAHGIGQTIVEEFRRHGAAVCVIDKAEGPHFVAIFPTRTRWRRSPVR